MKKIKLPDFKSFFESSRAVAIEYKKTRKFEHSMEADVLVVYPNSHGEWQRGITDEANNFLLIPLMQKAWHNLFPINMPDGKRIFIAPIEFHETLDIVAVGKFFTGIKANIKMKVEYTKNMIALFQYYWKYHDSIVEFEIKNIPSTINPNIYNNKFSRALTTFVHLILSTKMLGFLEETPRRIFILSMCIAGLIGMVIGGTGVFIGMVIFIYFIK